MYFPGTYTRSSFSLRDVSLSGLYIFFTHANTATIVDSFVDAAYDELSTIRNEWNGILEDHTISLARRHMVIGVMGRLSVIMQICMNLGVIANMLEEQSYAVTPSAEASEVCELSYTYLPEDTRRGTVRIAVISDD